MVRFNYVQVDFTSPNSFENLMNDFIYRHAISFCTTFLATFVTVLGADLLTHAPIALTGALRDCVGPRVQVKAAGRFKDAEEVSAAFVAGATHLAAVLTPGLIEGMAATLPVGPLEPAAVRAAASRR